MLGYALIILAHGRLKQGDCKFKASQDHIARLYLKKKKITQWAIFVCLTSLRGTSLNYQFWMIKRNKQVKASVMKAGGGGGV